jgi:hypothetical protein
MKATLPSMLLLLLVCTGCGGDDQLRTSEPALSVTDSAGIQIVTSGEPAWADGAGWRIEETPSLDIGVEQGEAAYLLANAHGATVMADGRIAVADMMTNQIRYYSPEGRFLKAVGGTGGGPGEFEQLYRLKHIAGDSLMGLEPATLTSIFSPAGEYIRRFDLDPVNGWSNIWWLGYLDGGRLLAVSLAREGTRHEASNDGVHESRIITPEKPVGYRDSLMHFLYDMNGRMIDSIGRMPGQNVAASSSQTPFPPHAAYAFRGDRMYHSPGNVVDIRIYRLASQGAEAGRALRLERIVRQGDVADLAVNDSIKDAYFAQQRRMFEQMRSRGADMSYMEKRLLETQFPPTIPAHANRMYVDPANNVWLKAYAVDPQAEGSTWLVFDDSGRWLGRVATPPRFEVNEIGTDYVLGIWRDDLDVEHVRRYAISK